MATVSLEKSYKLDVKTKKGQEFIEAAKKQKPHVNKSGIKIVIK